MTSAQLIKKIEKLGLKLPAFGTGRGGKILNSDLEDVIAEHYAKELTTWGQKTRYDLGHVMLAARYDECKEPQQADMFRDHSDWFMEEKYDGVRIALFRHDTEGYSAFGRNRSKHTCLPIEYTQNILVKSHLSNGGVSGVPLNMIITNSNDNAMIDCEVVTDGFVELPDGSFATGLNAVNAVLSQSDPNAAHHLQRTTCPLQLIGFDFVPVGSEGLLLNETYEDRWSWLQEATSDHSFIRSGVVHERNKEQLYNQFLTVGKEGVVFKRRNGIYVPARNNRRDKDVCVKCKRTMRGANASDIDAWIGEGYSTPEWSKLGLVGGLNLYVYLRDESGELTPHHIASVASMPDEIRQRLSQEDGTLKNEWAGRILTIDGQDVSSRNRRITHARVDWKRGVRNDKTRQDCVLDAEFLDSQIF